MKNLNRYLALSLMGALLFGAQSLQAHEGHSHAADSSKAMVMPTDAKKSMDVLNLELHAIEIQLAAGKLDSIHEHAKAIEEATTSLDQDPNLDAQHKTRVQGYVKNVAMLADKLHDAADAKKLDQTKKEFQKLKTQVQLLGKQFAAPHPNTKP